MGAVSQHRAGGNVNAQDFSRLVDGARTGAGRWKARCPAHTDRSPSLSIREGEDGRVLVRCFAGCTVEAILAVLNLSIKDLFAGPPPSPQQMAAIKATQEAHQQATREKRRARLAALDREEKLQAVVNALGAKLALTPDNDRLEGLFNEAMRRLHIATSEVDKYYPQRGAIAHESEIHDTANASL